MRLIVDKGSRQRVWDNVERITVDRESHNDKLCWELSEPEEIGCDNVVDSWSEMCVGVEAFIIEPEPGEDVEPRRIERSFGRIDKDAPDVIVAEQHEVVADGGRDTPHVEISGFDDVEEAQNAADLIAELTPIREEVIDVAE
ncbi:hypothetical protein [Natranaeroarchaeum sulfidigenes]|uniref:Uncharacterized protein n=1 Tax=Natranaeroarchaeum sulfidigenes TaxID=2784880 RepID=A0A897MRA5_9EURY|nr:hypothetical protein [Natranaeroarchaeum sulfidigenes]QSG02538.1 hypothetical protein AArcS_1321 [Natranaeroarchaeum sulfidigenes]